MLAFILRLVFDGRVATLAGAALAGHSELGPTLIDVARRESRLELIGVHAIDARWSASLRPQECFGQDGWSTRGIHGMMAAHALQYAPRWARCSPWILDIPIVSAWLAARRASSWRCWQHPRCRSWLGVAQQQKPIMTC